MRGLTVLAFIRDFDSCVTTIEKTCGVDGSNLTTVGAKDALNGAYM